MTTAPITPATDYEDSIGDDGVSQDRRLRSWRPADFFVILLAGALFLGWIGFQNWKHDQMIKQLPGVVVVEKDATLVDYIVSGKGNQHRLKLAVLAAEEMKRPLTAVETNAGREKPLLGDTYRYGTAVPVDYDQARSLVAYSDSVKISMLIYPGDLLDPKRGKFISRDNPQAVLDYLRVNTRCGSGENAAARLAFAAAHSNWMRANNVSLHPTIYCRGRSSDR